MKESEQADSLAARITEFVSDLIRTARFDLDAEVRVNEAEYRVILTGNDISLLLAKNAELLNSIEYVTQRVFMRQVPGQMRIAFDGGDYRSSREAELRLMAQKAAEKVKLSGTPFVFDPMNPGERRIIHLALVDDSAVRTESQGDGYNRKVVILPAN